jgi:hypothetical protein
MEQALWRLAGVADVRSDYRTGLMQVQWRPGVPFDLGRLKSTLLTWRGGVRFGSAEVVATGSVVPWEGRSRQRPGTGPAAPRPPSPGGGAPAHSAPDPALRVAETGQRFGLRARRGEPLPAPGARVRITGDVELPRRGEEGCDLVVTVQRWTECAP